MNIIGLGGAGCKTARCFEIYPQYKTFFIDTEQKDRENFFKVVQQETQTKLEMEEMGAIPRLDQYLFQLVVVAVQTMETQLEPLLLVVLGVEWVNLVLMLITLLV